MRRLRRDWALLIAVGGLVGLVGVTGSTPIPHATSVAGIVEDDAGPVPGAVVRVQATPLHTTTDMDGRFALTGLPADQLAKLTAFAPGYYIAGPVPAEPGDIRVSISLRRHPDEDNAGYRWVSAFSRAGDEGNCENCHSDPNNPNSLLPFDEWLDDAHGRSAINRRFLSMYNGTDLSGEYRSPETRYSHHKDYGRIPLPPDPDKPYYGPGFKLDFPESAGNCAACHLPAAAVDAAYGTDPNEVSGVGLDGVACDFCHKVWDIRLNPSTGLPYANMPGVLSSELLRPPAGHQLFIGPFDDVAPGEDTYAPLQEESRFCASCHFGQFWGVQVYNSYGEWLASPYSDPETGQTCQDCHMPRRGATHFARPDRGGLERDPERIFSHLMPGANDMELLRNTAELAIEAERQGDRISVDVRVTNANAGHHLPTGHPARNILLLVSAVDARGHSLEHVGDQVIPDWGGAEDQPGGYAGQPGKGYAKILEEMWTEIAPTVAYWRQTVLREDTRIPALATDVSHYEFRAAPEDEPITIRARLIFRRAFKLLMDQKDWQVPDILMEKTSLTLR